MWRSLPKLLAVLSVFGFAAVVFHGTQRQGSGVAHTSVMHPPCESGCAFSGCGALEITLVDAESLGIQLTTSSGLGAVTRIDGFQLLRQTTKQSVLPSHRMILWEGEGLTLRACALPVEHKYSFRGEPRSFVPVRIDDIEVQEGETTRYDVVLRPDMDFPPELSEAILSREPQVISEDFVLYSLRGSSGAVEGAFEIGVRPAGPGSEEKVVHRFFRPDN